VLYCTCDPRICSVEVDAVPSLRAKKQSTTPSPVKGVKIEDNSLIYLNVSFNFMYLILLPVSD
jgi:hypothetical protein